MPLVRRRLQRRLAALAASAFIILTPYRDGRAWAEDAGTRFAQRFEGGLSASNIGWVGLDVEGGETHGSARLIVKEGGGAVNASDAKVAGFVVDVLRPAVFTAVPRPHSSQRPVAYLSQAIRWIVQNGATSVYIPREFVPLARDFDAALWAAVKSAWTRGVPLLTDATTERAPAGFVPVDLRVSESGDCPDALDRDRVFTSPTILCGEPGLTASWERVLGSSKPLTGIYASALIGTAATNAGNVGLARVRSLIWAGSVFPKLTKPEENPAVRPYLISDDAEPQVALGGTTFQWSTKLSDIARIVSRRDVLGPATGPEGQILSIANEGTKVVDLAAIERSLRLLTLQIVPSTQSYVSFRLPQDATSAERQFVLEALRTLEGARPDDLFLQIMVDELIRRRSQGADHLATAPRP